MNVQVMKGGKKNSMLMARQKNTISVKCNDCKYTEMYNYGYKIFYCNNDNRKDDMGKLGIGELPEESPEWCPLRER